MARSKPEIKVIDGVIYKQCPACKEFKHTGKDYSFHAHGFMKLQSYCIECKKIRNKEYYTDNREEHMQQTKNNNLKNLYQISRATFDELSKNGCESCGEKEGQLCVDHDHKTSKVRGVLCTKCNFALGLLLNDENLILKLAAYIRERSKENFSIEQIEDSYAPAVKTEMERIVSKARGISIMKAREILRKGGI